MVRIDREERRNAIDRATAEGLEEAFDLLDDDALWAGVVTGTKRVFSAGTGPTFACRVAASTGSSGGSGGFTLAVVNEVAEPGQALAGAMGMAREICEASPVAVGKTLRALDAQVSGPDVRGWEVTAGALDAVLASEDFRVGIEAFAQRGVPQWRGR